MVEKRFNEKKFMELLKNPSTMNSETIPLTEEGVLPKKETR
jgi:hypothetical protein